MAHSLLQCRSEEHVAYLAERGDAEGFAFLERPPNVRKPAAAVHVELYQIPKQVK